VPGFFLFSGEKLREVREDADLTREELALAAHLSFPMIAALEYGQRSPSVPALLRLASAAGVEPGDLVEESPFEAAAR
jgi:transcriptional regulator with XRE-family HTH domain